MRLFIWFFFFFSSRRRHTRCGRDWSSDVCSSDLPPDVPAIVPRSCQRPRDRSNRRALALRGIDGWRKIATVSRHTTLAAALAFAFLTAPVAAGAQPPGKVYLIGILADRAADANEILAWQIFRAGLRERGWKEGVNIRIKSRWIEGNVA